MPLKRQPAKLAAMEAYFHTQEYAPLVIGGIPDTAAKKVNYGMEIPGLLSFLVHDNFKTSVNGLDKIPVKRSTACSSNALRFPDYGGHWYVDDVDWHLYFYSHLEKERPGSKPWFLKTVYLATPLGLYSP
jgi:cytochrome d ubiquinol oxidase subunit I